MGQCSLTVALPILSACGHETAILPSAVLSTHTSGFTGFTFRDLVEDMPAIGAHWQKEGIRFAAVYTGYLGSVGQVDYVRHIMSTTLEDGGLRIVDPAMADNGKLYPLFGQDYVEAMKTLCFESDILLPNITEACYLTGMEYRAEYDESYIDAALEENMDEVVDVVVLGRACRNAAAIKNRQPVSKMYVKADKTPDESFISRMYSPISSSIPWASLRPILLPAAISDSAEST